MRQLLILLLLLPIGTRLARAQDFIGYKLAHVRTSHIDDKYYGPPQVINEGGCNYIIYNALDGDHKKAYYFNDSNQCVKYIYLSDNMQAMTHMIRELNKNFKRLNRSFWYDPERSGIIVHLDKYNHFFAVVIEQNLQSLKREGINVPYTLSQLETTSASRVF